MRKIVEGRGGRFIWSGRVTAQVVGAGGEGFEMVGLVEYPSRKVFVEIATSPEVAAIGVPDEKSGEAVKIVVVKKDENLTERELLEHCRQHLTNYKMPRMVEFRTEPLPKTNIGKILRRELRAPPVSTGQETTPA